MLSSRGRKRKLDAIVIHRQTRSKQAAGFNAECSSTLPCDSEDEPTTSCRPEYDDQNKLRKDCDNLSKPQSQHNSSDTHSSETVNTESLECNQSSDKHSFMNETGNEHVVCSDSNISLNANIDVESDAVENMKTVKYDVGTKETEQHSSTTVELDTGKMLIASNNDQIVQVSTFLISSNLTTHSSPQIVDSNSHITASSTSHVEVNGRKVILSLDMNEQTQVIRSKETSDTGLSVLTTTDENLSLSNEINEQIQVSHNEDYEAKNISSTVKYLQLAMRNEQMNCNQDFVVNDRSETPGLITTNAFRKNFSPKKAIIIETNSLTPFPAITSMCLDKESMRAGNMVSAEKCQDSQHDSNKNVLSEQLVNILNNEEEKDKSTNINSDKLENITSHCQENISSDKQGDILSDKQKYAHSVKYEQDASTSPNTTMDDKESLIILQHNNTDNGLQLNKTDVDIRTSTLKYNKVDVDIDICTHYKADSDIDTSALQHYNNDADKDTSTLLHTKVDADMDTSALQHNQTNITKETTVTSTHKPKSDILLGTNQANELISNEWLDSDFIDSFDGEKTDNEIAEFEDSLVTLRNQCQELVDHNRQESTQIISKALSDLTDINHQLLAMKRQMEITKRELVKNKPAQQTSIYFSKTPSTFSFFK